MSRISSTFHIILGFAITVSSIGCGSREAGDSGSSQGPQASDGILDLKNLLQAYSQEKKPLPKSVGDLTISDEASFPAGTAFLQNGEVIYFWGSELTAEGTNADTIIAYEKGADTNGGWALMQDGTLKNLTSAEFASAPKASGKK